MYWVNWSASMEIVIRKCSKNLVVKGDTKDSMAIQCF